MKIKGIIIFLLALLSSAFAIYVISSASKTLSNIEFQQRLFNDQYTFEVYKQTIIGQLCNGTAILLSTWSLFLKEQHNIFNPNDKKYNFNFFKPIIYLLVSIFFIILFPRVEIGTLTLSILIIPAGVLVPLSSISLIFDIIDCIKRRKNKSQGQV